MKILFMLNSQYAWKTGCWLYRVRFPGMALREKEHKVRYLALGREIVDEWMNWPDVVVYGRGYAIDVIPSIEEYKKLGKRVVCDIDDDVWNVNPDNPAETRRASADRQSQTAGLLKASDVVTTTTDILKKQLQKFNKNVVVIPNSFPLDKFPQRKQRSDKLRIGYTGAASHWGDLSLILDVVYELQQKHEFDFILQGLIGVPIIAEIYTYRQILRQQAEPERKQYYESALELWEKLKRIKFIHIPFYPPELYPALLSDLDLDIGLAPLQDNKFNQSKSCIKMYEYTATGTPTLASNVLPYSNEVGYCAKNKYRDWYRKLEKLIVDKDFREKLLSKQQKFVQENRDIKKIVELYEKTYKG